MHQRFQINKGILPAAPVQQADAVDLNNDAALKTLQQRHNSFQTLRDRCICRNDHTLEVTVT